MISVIIPTYNRHKTIAASVNSVLNQTYRDIEVLVIDDGSTDDTAEIIQGITDPRLIYYCSVHVGACGARNLGITYARGEYIAFQDSDDIWHADKLEKQLNQLTVSNGDIVFCKLCFMSGGSVQKMLPQKLKTGVLKETDSLFHIGTQTILAKREVFEHDFFNEKLPRFQDLELLYRLSSNYKICCLDEGLVDYVIQEDSISSQNGKLLSACEQIRVIHPQLRRRNPQLAKDLSWILYVTSAQERGTKDYRSYLKLSHYYCHSVKYCVIRGMSLLGWNYGI